MELDTYRPTGLARRLVLATPPFWPRIVAGFSLICRRAPRTPALFRNLPLSEPHMAQIIVKATEKLKPDAAARYALELSQRALTGGASVMLFI